MSRVSVVVAGIVALVVAGVGSPRVCRAKPRSPVTCSMDGPMALTSVKFDANTPTVKFEGAQTRVTIVRGQATIALQTPISATLTRKAGTLPFRPKQPQAFGGLKLSDRSELHYRKVAPNNQLMVAVRAAGAVLTDRLGVPCDQLVLDYRPVRSRALDAKWPRGGVRAAFDGRKIQVFATPTSGAPTLSLVEPTANVRTHRRSRGGRFLVDTRWADGTRLKGWVPKEQLIIGALGYSGVGAGGDIARNISSTDTWVTLKANAPLLSLGGNATWGKVTAPLRALVRGGEQPGGFIRVLELTKAPAEKKRAKKAKTAPFRMVSARGEDDFAIGRVRTEDVIWPAP